MKKMIIILIVLLTVTAPWWMGVTYLGTRSLYGRVDKVIYQTTSEFDCNKWQKPNNKYRYAVLEYVSTNIITSGMTQIEVAKLLGQPDSKNDNNIWQYEAKRPGWRLIDFSGGGLAVYFSSNNIVTNTENNTWID